MLRFRQLDLVHLLEVLEVEDQHVFLENIEQFAVGRDAVPGHKSERRVVLFRKVVSLDDLLLRQINYGELRLLDLEAIDLFARGVDRRIEQLVVRVRRETSYPDVAFALAED